MKRFTVFALKKIKGGEVTSRAGSAVQNRDGTINVYLDVLPVDGRLLLKEMAGPERSEAEEQAVERAVAPLFEARRCTTQISHGTLKPGEERGPHQCFLALNHAGECMTERDVRQAREIAGVKSTSGDVREPCLASPDPKNIRPCLRPKGHGGAHGGY